MSTAHSGHGPTFRDRMHDLLRTSILEAAGDAAARSGWASVRMVDIAKSVGVSRQTIYNEFGTKDDLAQALFTREVARFQKGLAATVERADSPPEAARNALTWLFAEVRGHAMLQWMLRDARDGNSEGALLPMLTIRADEFALPIRRMLLAEFIRKWPGADRHGAELAIDIIIRWAITQIVVPTDFDEDEVIDRLVEMTSLSLR